MTPLYHNYDAYTEGRVCCSRWREMRPLGSRVFKMDLRLRVVIHNLITGLPMCVWVKEEGDFHSPLLYMYVPVIHGNTQIYVAYASISTASVNLLLHCNSTITTHYTNHGLLWNWVHSCITLCTNSQWFAVGCGETVRRPSGHCRLCWQVDFETHPDWPSSVPIYKVLIIWLGNY